MVSAFFASMFARFGKWIAAIVAILGAIAAIFFAGRKSGKADEVVKNAEQRSKDNEAIAVRQVNEAREAAKFETETVKGASDVQANVNRLNPGDAANRLRDEWSRD